MSTSPNLPPGRRVRSSDVWVPVLLGLSVVHLVFDWIVSPNHRYVVNFIDFAFLDCLCLAAVWLFLGASRRPDFPSDLARGLRWATIPILLQAVIGLLLIAMNWMRAVEAHGRTWANIPLVGADVAGILSSVAMVVGLFRLPRAHNVRRGIVRSVVDGLTFVVGAGIPLWIFSLKPLIATSASADDFFTAFSPMISFGGLLTLSWALETRAAVPNRGAVGFLLSGTAMLLLSDILFSIGKTSGLDYGLTLNLNNFVLHCGFGLWLIAGWRYSVNPMEGDERRSLVEFSPLPLITIVVEVGFFVLLMLIGQPDPQIYPKLLAVLFLFLIILFFRETFVIRDSLRLVAADATQKTQARFEALVRHSSDVVIVVSHERIVRFASLALKRVLGVGPESIVGRDLLDFIHPEDRGEGAIFLDRLVRNPTQTATIEWRFSCADGEVHHLESAGSNLLGEPEIEGLVLNSRDVGERRRMEEQLRQTQRMEAIGQLAGGIAHDFNNILTAILMQVAFLQEDHQGSPQLLKGLGELENAAKRAAGLTRQLLLFSRRQVAQKGLIDFDALLGNLLTMLRRLIGENISIEFKSTARAKRVTADTGMLEQVVMNLVVNARDAIEAGGRITLTTDAIELDASGVAQHPHSRPGSFVCLTVADTGHGMTEATLKRIFEPFFTTKEPGRGTGLGLATVFGVVKQHEGWIEVKSEVGRGTSFSVFLPATKTADPEAPVAHLSASSAPGGCETVLLVEDDNIVRDLAHAVLRNAGYVVLVASAGPEAISLWTVDGPRVDLLLTDMVMPGGFSGLDLAHRFRTEKSALKVILMSGYSQELNRHGVGPDDHLLFLAKPFDVTGLLKVVRQSLNAD